MYGDISLGVGMEFASFDRDYVQKLAARDTEVERHFTSYFSDLLAIKLRTKCDRRPFCA
jgi:hypothetical protein